MQERTDMWKNKKSSKDLADRRNEGLELNESQELGSSEDKKICHGLGCFNYAEHSIQEDGYDGILILCNNCIKRFPERVTGKPRMLNNRLPKQHTPTPRVRIDQSNSGKSKL